MMLSLSKLIEPFFIRAGWRPRAFEAMDSWEGVPSHVLAERIIGEFAGLSVGETGPGTEEAASDVHFYSHSRAEVSVLSAPWASRTGALAAFATAHNDHMILLVGGGGRFYVFTDVDERLYDAGEDFGELMYRLLFGYMVGVEVPREGGR